ncbi:MAG: hypothetical protein IJH84_25090 [Saccharopolyspora sp.]|uniref:hypothetical protein n=1 Tax=Saccharopolyspora sp. TaxID=33915 RepID=UPI0025E69CB5|nr:hypothetical protein [Saccharopolyspora sp.]MBQ6644285.1 hypothetical protein [Saccharopolyspora sp.]
MKFADFADGFRLELANREFARSAMTLLAARAGGCDSGPFWVGYAKLEEFNAPRYRAAARRMKISFEPDWRTRTRGWLVGHTPMPLLHELLRIAYPRTVEYAEDIRRLKDAGPPREAAFLDYMIRQDLQVRMMHAALIGTASEVTALVDEFIASER